MASAGARIFDHGPCPTHKAVAPLGDGGNVTTQSPFVLEFRTLIDRSFVSACGAFANRLYLIVQHRYTHSDRVRLADQLAGSSALTTLAPAPRARAVTLSGALPCSSQATSGASMSNGSVAGPRRSGSCRAPGTGGQTRRPCRCGGRAEVPRCKVAAAPCGPGTLRKGKRGIGYLLLNK